MTFAPARWPFHAITLVLLCELESSAVGAIDVAEIIEVEFFAEDQLPPFSVRASADQLAAAFAHERDRSLPTAFD